MQKLSVYILTFNSERRLVQVLDSVTQIADEIVVVDSGSSDSTMGILSKYPVRMLHRKFDNFRDQRVFAEDSCNYQWVLALDSDEVLSDALVHYLRELKERDFDAGISAPDVFVIRREWYFLEQHVRNFYPVRSPEFIPRLFRRDRASTRNSPIIHECLQTVGLKTVLIDKPILHYSCDSIDDLYDKIGLYTKLSAEDLYKKGERTSWIKLQIYPWLIWARWIFLYGSWRDGDLGRILARYARITVYLKYLKLKYHDKMAP